MEYISEIINISKTIYKLKKRKIFIKKINDMHEKFSSYVPKISIMPYMINISPNTDLQIIILSKKIFDICRVFSSIEDVNIISIEYVYEIITIILTSDILTYLSEIKLTKNNESQYLFNIFKNYFNINFNIYITILYIFNQVIRTNIYDFENLLLHCDNCDLNILTEKQIQECMSCLNLKKKIHLRILLVYMYEIHHILNNHKIYRISDWYSKLNINDCDDLIEFIHNPLNETLLLLSSSKS